MRARRRPPAFPDAATAALVLLGSSEPKLAVLEGMLVESPEELEEVIVQNVLLVLVAVVMEDMRDAFMQAGWT